MAIKIINFDLYKLKVKNFEGDSVQFENILLDKLELYKSIHVGTDQVSIIDTIKKEGKFIFGTLAHTQLSDLPPTLDITTGEPGEIPLKESQGLAYYTSFLFDPELQMIAYESKKNGVTLNSFLGFFQLNYNLNPIESEIVIDPIELERLNRMGLIKKFQVKIAKVVNGSIFNSNKSSFKQIINSADDTNTNVLEYTLTADRGNGNGLSINKIKQIVKDLLAYKETDEVEKLIITGKETDESATDVIDFIANRVRISIKVERKRLSSDFALSDKYFYVTEQYLKIQPHLLVAYKMKKV